MHLNEYKLAINNNWVYQCTGKFFVNTNNVPFSFVGEKNYNFLEFFKKIIITFFCNGILLFELFQQYSQILNFCTSIKTHATYINTYTCVCT